MIQTADIRTLSQRGRSGKGRQKMSTRLFGLIDVKADTQDSNDESDMSFSGLRQVIRPDLPFP